MATLSSIITPTNIITANNTLTLTNKTISGASNTITNIPLSTGVTGTLPVANGGTGVTTSTGSGANVLGTSPSITNPTLNLSGVAGANNSVLEIIQASSLYF